MSFDKFFTVEEEDSEGLGIRVRPTRYVRRLHPHKAMAELEAYIDALYQDMSEYQDALHEKVLHGPENLQKVGRVLFELETCQHYLTHLETHYKTIH